MPGAVTVIDEVVAPVLHNKVPVASVDNVELPQLFCVVTFGADGPPPQLVGFAVPVPGALVQLPLAAVTV